MAKPELAVVGSPAAPAGLGKAGLKLWQAIQAEYWITDAPGCETLWQ